MCGVDFMCMTSHLLAQINLAGSVLAWLYFTYVSVDMRRAAATAVDVQKKQINIIKVSNVYPLMCMYVYIAVWENPLHSKEMTNNM